jgi:hypothetical protein
MERVAEPIVKARPVERTVQMHAVGPGAKALPGVAQARNEHRRHRLHHRWLAAPPRYCPREGHRRHHRRVRPRPCQPWHQAR